MDKAADAFRTISEVSVELDVPKHVLRFWESRFPQIKPMKRGGGRRYYRPDDLELLRGVTKLLYRDGYTIRGVQRILRDRGTEYVKSFGIPNGAVIEGIAQEVQAPSPREAGAPQTAYAGSVDRGRGARGKGKSARATRSAGTGAHGESSKAGGDALARQSKGPASKVRAATKASMKNGAASAQSARSEHSPKGKAKHLSAKDTALLKRALRELETCRRILTSD